MPATWQHWLILSHSVSHSPAWVQGACLWQPNQHHASSSPALQTCAFSRVATGYTHVLFNFNVNEMLHSALQPVSTFQVLHSHMWLLSTTESRVDTEHFHHPREPCWFHNYKQRSKFPLATGNASVRPQPFLVSSHLTWTNPNLGTKAKKLFGFFWFCFFMNFF